MRPLPNASFYFCLDPFSTIYTAVSIQIATDITRGVRGHVHRGKKTEKSRNCYRDALFDVEPRKSQAKTRKGERETVSSTSYLAHRYPGEISFLHPFCRSFFVLLSLLYNPPRLDDGFHERGILCESRKLRNLTSLSLSLSRPRSKLLTFYHARSSTRATTRCTLDRNVNRIRGLLFPVPRKIHFPSEEGSAPPHPRLIFSFRFTRVPLAFDTAKRRRLIASINDDTFYRGFSPLPLPPNTRHSETVFMDL